jgi:hypothetical protein
MSNGRNTDCVSWTIAMVVKEVNENMSSRTLEEERTVGWGYVVLPVMTVPQEETDTTPDPA